jgi:hypothetical protein
MVKTSYQKLEKTLRNVSAVESEKGNDVVANDVYSSQFDRLGNRNFLIRHISKV